MIWPRKPLFKGGVNSGRNYGHVNKANSCKKLTSQSHQVGLSKHVGMSKAKEDEPNHDDILVREEQLA